MRQKLRRVVVVSDNSVASGGAAGIALASIRMLSSRGVPVTVLTGDEGTNPDLARSGVNVVSLGGRNILEGNRAAAALRGLYDPATRSALRRWIAANDGPGTVYHLHNWHKVLSASPLGPLSSVADRLVLTAHDFFLACPNGGFFDFGAQRVCSLTPLSVRCLAANCDKSHYGHKIWRVTRHGVRRAILNLRDSQATVLAVHEGMVPLLQKGGVPARVIMVLRNPVTPWQHDRVTAERNRTVLFVGRLEIDKGIDTLATACSKARIPLQIVGDGPLRDRIRSIYPAAEMLGRLARSQIAELSKLARMVVLPTRVRETFGLVAFEACMSGVPVISSTSALTTDELVAIGAAKECPPNDPELLFQEVSALLNDDLAVASMSQRGFEHARSLAPTEEEWCSRLIQIYEQKLAAASS